MRNRYSFILKARGSLIAYIVIMLLISSAVLGYDAGSRVAPLVQAGLMSKAPGIDGVIGADEWSGAASVGMFHVHNSETLLMPAATAQIGFDKDNLYIAVTIPIANSTKLKAEKRDRDGAVWEDDAVEIFIDPLHNHNSDYQFSVNAVGSMADSLNTNGKWNGEWTAAASQTAKYWQVEAKIPLATLGLSQLQVRRMIGLNIALDRTEPQTSYFSWAQLPSGSFHQPALFGHVILDPAGSAASGNIAIEGSGLVFNAATIPATSDVTAALNVSRDGVSVGNIKMAVTGQNKLSVALPSKEGRAEDGDYKYEAEIVQSGNQLLYSSGVVKAAAVRPLSITLRKFFVQGKLTVDADASALVLDEQPLNYSVEIIDESGKQVTSSNTDGISSRKATFNFDISSLPFKPHTVRVLLTDASGNELASAQESFTRPQVPAWVGSKAGKSDKVLPPWTPLNISSVKGNIKVSPWGRTYAFNGMPFPSSVITRNADILSGPIVFRLSMNGKPVTFEGSLKVTKKTDSQVVLAGDASAGDLKAHSVVTIDYDGNTVVNMKLSCSRDVTIDKLTLEAPIQRKHAKYRYYFPGEWSSSKNARALPADGWKSDFVPYVWLGDDDRGFALYTTSDQNWTSDKTTKAIEVVPVGTSTMALRFNVITQPLAVTAGKSMDYTFGFEATPNKKPDKDVWDYRICQYGSYSLPDTFSGKLTSLTYPAGSVLDPVKGSMEMWVRVNFDPTFFNTDTSSRGLLNHDLVNIKTPTQNMAFYWNIDVGGLRLVLIDGSNYPVMLDTALSWKQNELHHLALIWGDEIKVYIDGKLTSHQKWTGIVNGAISDVMVQFAGQNPGFEIDELRISDVEREITVPTAPYIEDEHTILLDHLDKLAKVGLGKFKSIPEKGTPGDILGEGKLTEGKFGKELQTMGERIPMLDYLKNLGVRTIFFGETWTEYQNYTETVNNQEKLKRLVKACHDKGMQVILYFGYEIASIAPEWDAYHNEMLVMPITGSYTREPAQIDRVVCYNSLWQDFMADGIDKMIQKYDIDGVYLDGTAYPWPCSNTSHGCGYTRPDGTIAPTYAFTGARDMMRRLYTVVKNRKPDGQVNLHNSLTMTIPSIGWATSTWDGEQFGFMNVKADINELFPLDSFRTEFMGRQWGVPSEMLCYEKPYTTHQAFSFTLLHDVLVRGFGQGLEEEAGLWKIMDQFGRKQSQFHPYFNNSSLVKVPTKGAYASVYVQLGKQVMCVVSNLGAKTADVRVNLSLKKMKLKNGITAKNAITGERLPIKDGSFSVNLSSFDYALILIK